MRSSPTPAPCRSLPAKRGQHHIVVGHIVVGLRAALEDKLRLSSRLVVDGAEIVARKRDNKLSLPHDALNCRSPPLALFLCVVVVVTVGGLWHDIKG